LRVAAADKLMAATRGHQGEIQSPEE